MYKKILMAIPAVLLLGGCAGANVGLDVSNSPSQCTSQEALGQVPAAQMHDYVQRCSAGYKARAASQQQSMKLDLPASSSSSE